MLVRFRHEAPVLMFCLKKKKKILFVYPVPSHHIHHTFAPTAALPWQLQAFASGE